MSLLKLALDARPQLIEEGVIGFHGPDAAEVLRRISVRQPLPKALITLQSRLTGVPRKEVESKILDHLQQFLPGGTINRGNVYLNEHYLQTPNPFLSREGIIAHEKFHAKVPVLGSSELLAHFYGGLHHTPGETNIPKALEQALIHFPMSRWGRALGEFGLIGAGAYGVHKLITKDTELNPLQRILKQRIGYDFN
jgi:hypothetical protein